jgi:DNA repair protein RadC
MIELQDRPREKLLARGVQAIGDEELVSILLGTGVRAHPAIAVASDLVRTAGSVAMLSRASPRELALVTGVGAARAARVAAAFELGRRAVEAEARREMLAQADDVYRLLAPRVAGLQQELFFAIGIDVRNHVVDVVEVARGTVHGVEVHPREVFRPLVRMAAAGVVVAHNHPSGDPTPSTEDVQLTRRLAAAGDLLGIPVVDHVVLGERAFRSVREWLGGEL